MVEKPKKKVVSVSNRGKDAAPITEATFTPTPEAKKQATTLRIIALVLWAVAIAAEIFAIFWVLKQDPINMILLVGILVGLAVLSIVGSILWKKANTLDPASRKQAVRFFIQNQLGLIIAIVAFLPLIILIFTNKNMDGKQKGIAGGIAIVLLVIAGIVGTDFTPPSQEQYTAEEQQVIDITGENKVFWTKSGKVFHLCQSASAVNIASKDNTIYSGTVAEAHAEGKERLTLQVEQEKKQCGFDTPAASDGADGADTDSEADGAEEEPSNG